MPESAVSSPVAVTGQAAPSRAEGYSKGDFTIISADNVQFCLPSFFVFANSGVIREMYEAGTSAPLVLRMTDPEIESRWAVKCWLNAMTGVDLPTNGFEDVAMNILLLARKYDCTQITKHITAQLYRILDLPNKPGFNVVPLAATFDEPELLAKVIKTMFDYHLIGVKEKEHIDRDLLSIPGAAMLDPSNWSIDFWRRTPVEYIWALTWMRKAGGTAAEQSEKFLSLIGQVKEPNSSKKRKLGEATA